MVSIAQVYRVAGGAPRTLAQNRAVHRRWLRARRAPHSSVPSARAVAKGFKSHVAQRGAAFSLAHDAINSRARQPHYLGHDV